MITTSHEPPDLPVVVIGAGPVGLAAAAHLTDRGLPFVVLEAGNEVGAAVREWSHIRTFTPWQYIVDPTAERLLSAGGWARPETSVPPTGAELVRHYLQPLGDVLAPHVLLGHAVVAVARDGLDKAHSIGRNKRPLMVRVRDARGVVRDMRARAVIDASGTWGHRNPLGAGGLPAAGELGAGRFLVGPLPDVLGRDRSRFAGRRTLVVGAGHSAANTLLSLGRLVADEPGTEVVWAIRGSNPARAYGGQTADQLPARGQLGADLHMLVESGAVRLVTGFAISAFEATGQTVTVVGQTPDGLVRVDGVHNVAAATGFRPDLSILSEVRLDLDPGLEAPARLAPLIDPAYHSCGTVPPHGHRDLVQPEEGLYVVGMKSYGRAPTFLITTGNEQVRSVVAALAGDLAAADDVRLVLPETGVCSVNAARLDEAAACCGYQLETVAAGAPGGGLFSHTPQEAHRDRPATVPAQGFTTGLTGGGLLVAQTVQTATATPESCCVPAPSGSADCCAAPAGAEDACCTADCCGA